MKKIKELIVRFYENDVIRYIFFGGCTTLVNLVVFYVMRKLGTGLNTANDLNHHGNPFCLCSEFQVCISG